MRLPTVLLTFALLSPACAGKAAELQSEAHPLIRDFLERAEKYALLRNDAGRGILPFQSTTSPGEIDAAQKRLAARIRERRSNARHGDIFTQEIRLHFRELIAGPLTGPREEAIRALLQQDAPDPGALPLEVNATYPTSQPYATTPPSVLALLPPLPKGLEYRFIGRDMVLLDQASNLIVDFMRNAVPKRAPQYLGDARALRGFRSAS